MQKGLCEKPLLSLLKVVIEMINDIYECNEKAYRVTQEKPLMGVEYIFDGERFKSIGEPVLIDGGNRITLSIVKLRYLNSSETTAELTKAEIIEKLEAKGVEYSNRSSKSDLLKLLEE